MPEVITIEPTPEQLAAISWNDRELVAAIVQDDETGEVLMMAWMSPESLRLSLAEGRTVFWSRSRQELWRKGDTSGHIQTLVDLRIDCDGDTLLVLVDQVGVAYHTGRHNCFFRAIRSGRLEEIAPVMVDMDKLGKG